MTSTDQTPTPRPRARDSRPEWSTMTRQDFDRDANSTPLFDLTPANVPAPADGFGTGDLLAELEVRRCHCGAPAQGPPSHYPDVCCQWPICEQTAAQ